MKTMFTALSLLFLSLTASAQTNTPADDARIRDMVKTLETGWAKKDGNLFASPFAENADYVIINGSYIKGKAAIAEGHQRIFDTFYKETNIKTEVQGIRYLRNDIAVVHVTSHLTGISNGQKLDGKGMITLTMVKSANGWQVEAFQNTPQAANPQTNK